MILKWHDKKNVRIVGICHDASTIDIPARGVMD